MTEAERHNFARMITTAAKAHYDCGFYGRKGQGAEIALAEWRRIAAMLRSWEPAKTLKPVDPEEPWVRVALAAKRVGVSPRTVYWWISCGLVEVKKTPKGSFRVRVSQLLTANDERAKRKQTA